MRDANICAARELESLALDIEQGSVSEAPLAEAVWYHRVGHLKAERDEARRDLGHLLAIIHSDGGHYQDKHGVERATWDANKLVIMERLDLSTAEGHVRALLGYGDSPFTDEEAGEDHVSCGLCGDTTEGCKNHDCPAPGARAWLKGRNA